MWMIHRETFKRLSKEKALQEKTLDVLSATYLSITDGNAWSGAKEKQKPLLLYLEIFTMVDQTPFLNRHLSSARKIHAFRAEKLFNDSVPTVLIGVWMKIEFSGATVSVFLMGKF